MPLDDSGFTQVLDDLCKVEHVRRLKTTCQNIRTKQLK